MNSSTVSRPLLASAQSSSAQQCSFQSVLAVSWQQRSVVCATATCRNAWIAEECREHRTSRLLLHVATTLVIICTASEVKTSAAERR
eukprot:13647-Heterococcus_DN1.PRE.2